MIETVLVPLDGSAFSEFALAPAVEIASRAGARLELMTVDDVGPSAPAGVPPDDAAASSGRRYLEEVGRRIEERLQRPVKRALLRGPPARSIEARADATEADLIVMSSHGRGPLSRAWLGSVTDRVVRHAPCPVLVVRPREDEEPVPGGAFEVERILVPVDRSEVSRSVLEWAVELGGLFHARFHFVTAILPIRLVSSSVHPYLSGPTRIDEKWFQEEKLNALRALDELGERMKAQELEMTTSVVEAASTAEGILAEAVAWEADVIAMGTHGRGPVPRALLGSVADKVLRGASIPVLLKRPDEGA